MPDDNEDDEEDFDTPTRVKTEPGVSKYETQSAKKRKVAAPKIEDFVGYAEDEGDDEGMGDAIDFSLAYPAEIKMEEDVAVDGANGSGNNRAKDKGKQKAEVVDLTETADANYIIDELCHQEKSNGTPKGKAKAKEQGQMGASGPVKNEVVDVKGMYEDEDGEMVV